MLLVRFTIAPAIFCAGCELVPLATLSAAVDIAGTAVNTGPTVYQHGKLDTVFMADYGNLQNAVRLTAVDLRLHLVRDRNPNHHQDIRDFQLQDDLKSKIEITVERRSPMLCRCRVDVGIFGSEPTARLLMSRIGSHLPSAITKPTDALKYRPGNVI